MAYLATGDIMSTATAATAIATDPSLPEIVQLVLKLKAIESSKPSSSGGGGSGGSGVGLRNVVGPLRTFVAIQEKPWILPVAVVGIFGSIFAFGYVAGKARRRRG